MKRTMTRFFVIAVTALLFLASVTAASACWFSSYQPEVPEVLRR